MYFFSAHMRHKLSTAYLILSLFCCIRKAAAVKSKED